MPLPQRLFLADVEHGKKDDDHKPGKPPLGGWQSGKAPQIGKWKLKRVALGILALVGVYYFIMNMPTDLENPRVRPSYGHPVGPNAPAPKPPPPVPQARPPKPKDEASKPKPGGSIPVPHDFNGPIKFYNLASTLHAVSKTRGSELVNQNVLFAAASLKSAAILLPIACEMAIRERNFVHFALMGRDEISMDILKAVNGIDKECKIIFHDGRPDFSTSSSDFRMEVSSASGFNHINTFVNPQATFLDASGEEEFWFVKGVKDRASKLGRTVIELPENAEESLMWITLLDSISLSAWNKVSVDIIIHAQPSASGSLIRLLESLKKADFFSTAPPRLTIELPHTIEGPTTDYLRSFSWPPKGSQIDSNLLTLHHRIPQHGLTPEANSIRMLESFWPANPYMSHVLILSPQVELSPLFYHYLKYAMLEYKFSTKAMEQANLLSISLDLPTAYLNDSTTFTPPLQNETNLATPFLWQAPSSKAALYFGDKWVELHSFVTKYLTSQHTLPKPETLHLKEVSKTHPSWLEHMLKLARARGYWSIYPNFEDKFSLATVHNDLFHLPEEYSKAGEESPSTGDLTADPKEYLSRKHAETPLIKTPLLSVLPLKGELPAVTEMPFLTWDGIPIETWDIGESAVKFSERFRTEIGGCEKGAKQEMRVDMDAGDLFCF